MMRPPVAPRSKVSAASSFRRAFWVVAGVGTLVAACGWDPSHPFDREAPQVNEALQRYDAGEADSAAGLLQDYLTTGACQEGNIGTPLRVRDRSNGSFDLGLALFKLAETYGHRFGEEENDAGLLDPSLKGLRAGQVECALRIVRAIAEDSGQPLALRARARYLEGNLLFLNADYKAAVTAYDSTLELAPGMGDAGPIGASTEGGAGFAADPIGRDAAWNRAVALRREEEKKDAGPQSDAGGDGGGNEGNDQKDAGAKDSGSKDGGKKDKKDKKDKNREKDAGKDPDEKPPKKDPTSTEPDGGGSEPPPPSRQSQDDRILDQLENAPTVQQEAAKKHGKTRKVPRGMTDK
jgi:hypothetical protein